MRKVQKEPLETQQAQRRHKLLPKEALDRLPPLGGQEGAGGETVAYVKLFSPYSRFTYYVAEFDGEDIMYGYCRSPLGSDCDEWGYQSFAELERINLGGVPGVERDIDWQPGPVREAMERCPGVSVGRCMGCGRFVRRDAVICGDCSYREMREVTGA